MPVSVRKWGPSLWDTLHSLAFSYPKKPTVQDQRNAELFLKSLGPLIPCEECRVFYGEMLKEEPPSNHLASRFLFTRYIYWMHTKVNEKLGKPNLSFRQVRIKYLGNVGLMHVRKSPISENDDDDDARSTSSSQSRRKRGGCSRCGTA